MELPVAFYCLVYLIQRDFFPAVIRMRSVDDIRLRFDMFDKAFCLNLPTLFKQFRSMQLLPDSYLLEWLMTLFAKQLPLAIVSRIWDCFFLHGELYVYKTACALLKLMEPELLEANGMHGKCMKILRTPLEHLKEKTLMETTNGIRIPDAVKKHYAQRRPGRGVDCE